MKILKTDYTSYPYWNAQVHSGWLEAEQNVYEDVRNEVFGYELHSVDGQ